MTINFSILTILFPLLLLLFGLGFTVVIDPFIQREHRRIILIIVILCFSLIGQNLGENELFVRHSNLALKNILSAYGYSVRPIILILFLYIIQSKGKKWLWWTMAGINAVLYFSSPFTKLCFEIRESDFASLRGPLWFTCFLISGILMLELLVRTIIRYHKTRRLEQFIPITIVIIIAISVALDMNVGLESQVVSFLTISIVASSVFYYIWLHLQFVREHEQDLKAAQRTQIMMTQIQPHFLFNALNTIRALYAKNPPLADRTLEDFSTYLRQNLESLNQKDLVPITKELEHTRLYVDIEVLRFPNVRVEYRIEDDAFSIPVLTIQPLVENAIRHGVRSCKDGLVIVSAVCEANAHLITIEDNGVGFDPKSQNVSDGSHIGLENVKNRIEQMCGGTMTIKSKLGEGTVVTISIPNKIGKENRKNENYMC